MARLLRSTSKGLRWRMLLHATSLIGLFIGPAAFAQQGSQSARNPSSSQRKSSERVGVRANLLLRSDADCSVTLDDAPGQELQAGVTRRVATILGEHLIEAVSLDGKDHWKTVIQMDKPAQKVVVIDLLKVKSDREAAEQQAARMQQEIEEKEAEIKHKEQLASEARTARQRLQQERSGIQDKIDALEQQVIQEGNAAQNDEERARGNDRDAIVSNNGTLLGSMVSGTFSGNANNARQSAKQHRQRAAQLRAEIVALQRRLQTVGQ